MTLDEYQEAALRTAIRQIDAYPAAIQTAWAAMPDRLAADDLLKTFDVMTFGLGLTGEAGEVVDLIKKGFGHGYGVDRAKLGKELGDVLWYLSNLADAYGIPLSAVASENVAKLRARYPDGFTVAASKAKADESSPTPAKIAQWADPDAAYKRVFNRDRVPQCTRRAHYGTYLCASEVPCEVHPCDIYECHCPNEAP